MEDKVCGGVGEQESGALASVHLYEDAGALESNRQASDVLKRRGRYHITPTLGKIFIVDGQCSLLRITVPKFGQLTYLKPLINTASLTSMPRTQMSWPPSRDQT